MLDSITPATPADFDAVWQLYVDVCSHMSLDVYDPGWILGVFPCEEDIRSFTEAGELYVGRTGGRIAAAMVLTHQEDPEHEGVPWPSGAAGEDVCVVHLLCGHPSLRGHGIGRELIEEAIRLARTAGRKAIHLEVMPGNLAASRIYLAAGFSYICNHDVYYEDAGTMTFEMYECVL